MAMNYRVVIVGGGMIGASLAYALRHMSIPVALIESRSIGVPEQINHNEMLDARTFALSPASRRIFENWGLWDRLHPYITPIQKIHVSQQGGFGVTRLFAKTFGMEDLGFTIPVSYLHAALLNELTVATNLDIFSPVTIKEVSLTQPHASLHIVTKDGAQHELTTELIVAADGSDSSLRQHLQIPTIEKDYQQVAIATNIALSRDHACCAYERFTREGPLGFLPLPDRHCASIWAISRAYAEEILALNDEDFLARIQSAIGHRLGRLLKIGKRQSFPLKLFYAREQFRAGLILLGNAAHTLHPVAAQGFNLSLRDVASLAGLLQQAVSQNRSLGHVSHLETYALRRKHDQRKTIAMSDGLVKLFSPTFLPIKVARSFGMMLMDGFPFLQQGFIRQSMGLYE